jgi:hypothetical protein
MGPPQGFVPKVAGIYVYDAKEAEVTSRYRAWNEAAYNSEPQRSVYTDSVDTSRIHSWTST